MLTERLVRLTEDVLVGRGLPPDMLASYRTRTRSDNSLRRRVYREGTLLAVWTGALFAVLIVVLAVSVVLNAIAPSSTATALVVVGFLGAFCLAGMAVHMVRYLVLLVVGLVRTGELIGASRQIRIGPDRPRTELVEPRWFVALTTPTDVDLRRPSGGGAGRADRHDRVESARVEGGWCPAFVGHTILSGR